MSIKRTVLFLDPQSSVGSSVTSHTLFGATCWALAALGQDVTAILADDERPFAYSAAFPCIRTANRRWLLLPAPPYSARITQIEGLISLAHDLKKVIQVAKRVKKARYILPGIAAKCRAGQWHSIDLVAGVLREEIVCQQGIIMLDSEKGTIWPKFNNDHGWPPLWRRVPMLHNTIDRLSGAVAEGLLFSRSETFYDRRQSGLWAALWAEESLYPILQGALRYLEDAGIGGDRSTGKGHFRIRVTDWDRHFQAAPPDAESFMNLSTFIPDESSAYRPRAYQLQSIRQKAENRIPLRAQRVYLASLRAFAPGSLFKAPAGADRSSIPGRLVCMGKTDSHPIYYSGLTIPLWGHWGAEKDA